MCHGKPADTFADLVVAFQSTEKVMTERQIAIGNQGVPLGSEKVGQGVEALVRSMRIIHEPVGKQAKSRCVALGDSNEESVRTSPWHC
jgi:hypothetical protein